MKMANFNPKQLATVVISGGPFMIYATLLIMSMNGSSYMFGLYSNDIKSSLHYDQTTLNLLSFSKDLGGNLAVLSGLIYEVVPPWLVLSIGSAMNFFGYFMMWLALTDRIVKPHVWQMCLLMWISANAQSFPNTGALVTCVRNFPKNRGVVIGLLKGFIGLSGAILTQLYHGMYGNEYVSVLFMLSWVPAVAPLIFLRTIRIMKPDETRKEIKIFNRFLFIALGLAGFILTLLILQNKLKFSRVEYIASAVVVVLFLILPLGIVVQEELMNLPGTLEQQPPICLETTREASRGRYRFASTTSIFNLPSVVVVPLLILPIGIVVQEELMNLPGTMEQQPPICLETPREASRGRYRFACITSIFNLPTRGADYTILQAIINIDMLILFISTTCGIGGALALIDNIAQIGKSLGYQSHTLSTFISLISIWNFLGRVTAGFSSELFLKKYNFPRPLMLSFFILLSTAGHLLIAFPIPNSLHFASIITGFCLGAQLPVISAIVSELFGLQHYSTMYNIGSLSSPLGSYIFNVRVAGRLYDKEALKQMKELGMKKSGGQGLSCIGVRCYRSAFLIVAGATVFGSVVSLALVVRTKEFYKGDIYKKFRPGGLEAERCSGSIRADKEKENVKL